ncbi:MAG: hypothetical protein KC486_07405 [Myxococcales bacterium]|nr:hypothetical protein [Myxococcales bacterium]
MRHRLLSLTLLTAAACNGSGAADPCTDDSDCAAGSCVDGECVGGSATTGSGGSTSGEGSSTGGDGRVLERGDDCDPLAPLSCVPGLVCTPFGTCEETCDEEHCAGNDSFCYSTSPSRVCNGAERPHCVSASGAMKVCSDVDVEPPWRFCGDGSNVAHYYHFSGIPDGDCVSGGLYFATSHMCLSAVQDTSITLLGGNVEVYTDDPTGFTDDNQCDYFAEVELTNLQAIGGFVRVGHLSGMTAESDLEVKFRELKMPSLQVVYGGLHYYEAEHAEVVNYPGLEYVGGFLVLDDLPNLTTAYLPGLREVRGSLRIHDVPALKTVDLGAIEVIDGYVSIRNAPCVDAATIAAIEAAALGPVSIDAATVATGEGC